MSDLIIEVGKFYKTRNGRKARIYAVDGADERPIHGAVFKHGEWFQCMWRAGGSAGDGTYFNTPEQYNFDLISPWTDPPVVDWDRLPKHIVAVAMDDCKEWFAYMRIPHEGKCMRWTLNTPPYETVFRIPDSDIPTFTGDWRDSLAVRPGCGE